MGQESARRRREDEVLRTQEERTKLNDALRSLFDLLEQHSPSWYTSEHRERAQAALQLAQARTRQGPDDPDDGSNFSYRTRREAARAFVRLPAWITISSTPDKEHVAFVRDISPKGIFFYSDFTPMQGEPITFSLEYLKGRNRIRLHLAGRVVRVEPTATATTGIAVEFEGERDDLPSWPNRWK